MTRYWAGRRAEGLDPLALLATSPAALGSCYLRTRSLPGGEADSSTLELAGVGEGVVLEAWGPDRLETLSGDARKAYAALVDVSRKSERHKSVGPLFVGGFSFDPNWHPDDQGAWSGFAPARLVLPELTLVRRGTEVQLVGLAPEGMAEEEATSWLSARLDAVLVALKAGPAKGSESAAQADASPERNAEALVPSEPSDSAARPYESQVRCALEAIAAGELTKVAVARSELLAAEVPFELTRLLSTLTERFSTCYIFCVQPAGADAFVGASPEQLLSCASGQVWADALAGTAGRSTDPIEDDALGLALMESSKERSEHEVVVSYLRRTLAPLTASLEAADVPRIMRLANVQHLHTAFRGELRNGEGVLDLARRVHPTPAVAGMPREEALRWLAEEEGLDRGWYAGGVGFVDPTGGGTFCVAIRSGLVAQHSVRLFAGAGIVEGSKPEREKAEVERKLAGLKEALFHA